MCGCSPVRRSPAGGTRKTIPPTFQYVKGPRPVKGTATVLLEEGFRIRMVVAVMSNLASSSLSCMVPRGGDSQMIFFGSNLS